MAASVYLALLLPFLTDARAQELPYDAAPPAGLEVRVAPGSRRVRVSPDRDGVRVGLLAAGEPFFVWERAPASSGCDTGWGRVAPDRAAWTCLDTSEATASLPRMLPGRVGFDPPTPDELAAYHTTGAWPRADTAVADGILPFVYLKRRRQLDGPVYASVDDLRAGRGGRAPALSNDLAFSTVLPDADGEIVVTPDGRAARLASLYAYAPSRFQGVDLATQPAPAGHRVGFSIHREPLPVLAEPSAQGTPVGELAYHEAFWIDDSAAAPRGWLAVLDPAGIRPRGYVRDDGSVRQWQDAPLPDGVAGTTWIDVDLKQQLLAVRHGAELNYITLVSTGKDRHETMIGVFTLTDKAAYWDMASLPGSADPYKLESVPWSLHFWPRYALHGAYWHDAFGRVVSHGCINLAPLDAAWIFDQVEPHLHEGWQLAYADAAEPGTTLRVRRGTEKVVDRRARSQEPSLTPTGR